ncbi:unnamed protein product, partial [Medioppia subpectinata]
MFDSMITEEWAAKMIDANGRLPSGVLKGTLTSFGDFDECIHIHVISNENNTRIRGKPLRKQKFESIQLNKTQITSKWFEDEVNQWLEVDNYLPFANGICFPSVCHRNEIKLLLGESFKTSNDPPVRRTEISVALIMIELSVLLVITGTIIDIDYGNNNRYNNKSEYRLQFIHGIRVLGTLWVILAHSSGYVLITVLTQISPFARYPEDAIDSSKSLVSQYILNASLSVQIFFIMSGCLTVYSTLSNKKMNINFTQFILLRWLRNKFTPPLVGMMCYTIALQKFGSGPLFQTDLLKPYLDPCYDNWWAHVLYFSNWYDFRQMCGIQTWYLSADFQLPVLETTLFFFGTHMHLISYFSGTWNNVVWLIVILLTIAIPGISYPILQEDIHPVNNTVSNAIMVVIMLITWSLCMSWIIYNCALSRAGVLPKLLSANFLQPLSRLSFCAYLAHLMLIWFNVTQIRNPITTNPITIGQYYCAIIVETFMLALVLYLTFEAPGTVDVWPPMKTSITP